MHRAYMEGTRGTKGMWGCMGELGHMGVWGHAVPSLCRAWHLLRLGGAEKPGGTLRPHELCAHQKGGPSGPTPECPLLSSWPLHLVTTRRVEGTEDRRGPALGWLPL